MRSLFLRIFLILSVSLCLFVMVGCGGDSRDLNLDEGWEWPTTQQEIGPEGGTIEVTDATSTLYGLKVMIPEGALAQKTTMVIQDRWAAAMLPNGLSSDYPIVEFGPNIMFSKDIQIAFPVQSIPSGEDGRILGAFYWDTTKEKWIVSFPERFIDSEMIIETKKFGQWRWGIVSLAEVETETVTSWMERLFEDWAYVQQAVIDELVVPWSEVYQDPQNLNFCDVQDSIMSQLSVIHEVARQGVADYLTINDISNQCPICTYDNFYESFNGDPDCSPSICDPTELATGQPLGWVINEWEGYLHGKWTELLAGPISGVPSELVGAMVAEGYYCLGAKELKCAWRCLLQHGNVEFYIDLLASNASYLSILAIEIYRANEGCIPR